MSSTSSLPTLMQDLFIFSLVYEKQFTEEDLIMESEKKRGRGRPRVVNLDDLVPKLLSLFDSIFFEDKKLSPPSADVWVIVGEKMQKNAHSAYTYFANDHQQIRGVLWQAKHPQKAAGDYYQGKEPRYEDGEELCQDSCSESVIDQPKAQTGDITFYCDFSKKEITELTEIKRYKNKEAFIYQRKFKEGWTSTMADLIWVETEGSCGCGFNFKHHSFAVDLTEGSAEGIF